MKLYSVGDFLWYNFPISFKYPQYSPIVLTTTTLATNDQIEHFAFNLALPSLIEVEVDYCFPKQKPCVHVWLVE